MFNRNFYPTTKELIRKMISTYTAKQLRSMQILDPSAGKGDIVQYLTGLAVEVPKQNIYCIEIEPELTVILQEKGFKVIGSDFLSFENTRHFDLVLMNPPFSDGAAHLLKAWEIIHSGDIVCILNAETINNPCYEDRQLLAQIIKDNGGQVEYLGNAFATAERPTGVGTVMVRLSKKAESKFAFDFKNTTKEKKFNLSAELFGDPIATRDVVGNMMIRFEQLREAYIEYLRVREKLSYFAQGLTKQVMAHTKTAREQGDGNSGKFNVFSDLVRSDMWGNVFSAIDGMEQLMTYNVQKDFAKFQADQGSMEFTRENVMSLLEMLHLSKHNIMDKAVIQVFDLLTNFHDDNRLHVEGWKTNNRYKVNQKVILPHVVGLGYNGYYEPNTYRETYKQFEDIDKVMCYLAGDNYDSLKDEYQPYHKDPVTGEYWSGWKRGSGLKGTIYKIKIGTTGWVESKYFFIRCYKKGTIHLKFKDRQLWEEFNMRACAGKKWLPEPEERAWRKKREKQQPKPKENQLMIAA
jgi:predicted RNA methylase